MIDLGYLHHGALLYREASRLWSDMITKDVLDLNNAFAEMLQHIRLQDIKGFKALCQHVSDHLYSLIKADLSLVRDGDVYAAGRLIQAFAYTGRLTLHDIDLTQQCLDGYMEVENSILDYSPSPILSSLNSFIKSWMKSFDPSRIRFNHGPGGVAGHGRVSLEVKYNDLTYDDRLTYAFGAPWWSTNHIRSSLDRISQTIFVPKSYKTFRTISMEPTTLQYCQQGVWGEIDRVVRSSTFLRNRLDFHDQTRNQRLAREGSICRNYATLDLSAASDSVSYDLVKKLFRGTKLLRYLVATRSSRTILPDGRLIDLKKFAPMGSSLCFPIETLVFASICAYVTRGHNVPGDFSVYGDDIIVPTQCAGQVIRILESLGFRVNHEKSFYQPTCWFRESCGGEYVDGFDVTPMRVSRRYESAVRLDRIGSLIDLSNAAYIKGYRNLRQFFLRKMRLERYSPLFGPDHVLADNYTNYHVRRRWNHGLQIIEAECSNSVIPKPEDQDESIRLRHWYEVAEIRRVTPRPRQRIYDQPIFRLDLRPFELPKEEAIESRIDRPVVEIKDRWQTKPYEGQDQPFIDWFVSGVEAQTTSL
jgi:hypothetical protein